MSVAAMTAGGAVVAAVAMSLAPETYRRRLEGQPGPRAAVGTESTPVA